MEPNFKFNWGAFLLPYHFAFANKSWKLFLSLIPFVGFIFQIIGGFQGERWAYESGEFSTLEEFQAVMKSWNRAGIFSLIVCIASFVLTILASVFLTAMLANLFQNAHIYY